MPDRPAPPVSSSWPSLLSPVGSPRCGPALSEIASPGPAPAGAGRLPPGVWIAAALALGGGAMTMAGAPAAALDGPGAYARPPATEAASPALCPAARASAQPELR